MVHPPSTADEVRTRAGSSDFISGLSTLGLEEQSADSCSCFFNLLYPRRYCVREVANLTL